MYCSRSIDADKQKRYNIKVTDGVPPAGGPFRTIPARWCGACRRRGRSGGTMADLTTKLNRISDGVSAADLAFIQADCGAFLRENGRPRRAYTHSFGCAQNVADGEKINGLLRVMGYQKAETPETADLILFNTCAVREGAEDRVYGHIGALKALKNADPRLMIVVCGCMAQRPEVAEKLKKSFPYVDIVFGTGAVHRLPSLIARRMRQKRRVFWDEPDPAIREGLPQERTDPVRALLPIMQGCNNFCTYCIVPYVRGREISRRPGDVIREARDLIAGGCREILLLGQNVNSYGKGLEEKTDFPSLLRELDGIEGDFRIRFMTSHPKDCTRELIDVISAGAHICRHIHLPVQSGSNEILRRMNRHYTVDQYTELIAYARAKMEDVTFSSDIIVGFPGENRADFEQTLDLVRRMRYNALFTFIYSRRSGTPAAVMEDPVSAQEKSRWFRELLSVQTEICTELNQSFLGKKVRVLFDGPGKEPGTVSGRTPGNVIVEAAGSEDLVGAFADVRITKAMNWAMTGEIV